MSHGHAHSMTAGKEMEATGEEVSAGTQSMSQAAANNNNNSQWLVGDGIANQAADSAMFCLSMAPPEAPKASKVPQETGRFPVGGVICDGPFPFDQQKHLRILQQSGNSTSSSNALEAMGFSSASHSANFPMHHKVWEIQRFPLLDWTLESPTSKLECLPIYQAYARGTPAFPLHQVYAPWDHTFPALKQLPRKNSGDNDALPQISTTMTRRSLLAMMMSPSEPQEFPIIKKQFVMDRRFPNYRSVPEPCVNGNSGGETSSSSSAQQTTTMTQTSGDKVTKINTEGGGSGGSGGDEVQKAFGFDNELEAEDARRAAALNLNAGVVASEIEHQQAENFNDAFGGGGQRHDHKNNSRGGGGGGGGGAPSGNDDAMDGAKNKREICEQSKSEKAEDHNELNMTKSASGSGDQEQSICPLARPEQPRQTIDGLDWHDGTGNSGNHQQQLSDARDSLPEQVREPSQYRYPQPVEGVTVTRPNIELLKSSVRAFLDQRHRHRQSPSSESSPPDWDWDWELLDLLTDAIELLCEKAETGNLWSESLERPSEPSDMTITKVSEERDSETLDVYPEQLDQQQQPEVDDNNNSPISDCLPSSDMKYELKTATSTPTATATALPSRSSRIPETPISSLRSTSRGLPATGSSPTPLLGELKRSSSSRDDIAIDPESVLPERTRLRRQRRMRSQDSVEEKPEDVIERLNKLKARISGALSEVKSVIKQYSTESEAEGAAGEPPLGGQSKEPTPAPVAFRFVKKVRRRSYFDEAEEESEAAREGEPQDTKVRREQTPFPKEGSKIPEEIEPMEKEKPVLQLSNQEEKQVNEQQETAKLAPKENQESAEKVKVAELEVATNKKDDGHLKDAKTPEIIEQRKPESEKIDNIDKIKALPDEAPKMPEESKIPEPPLVNGEVAKESDKGKAPEKSKSQTKIEFLAKVQSELKSKGAKEKPAPREPTGHKETIAKKEEPPAAPSGDVTDESCAGPAPPKIKKKVIVKAKNPRRASIAAVEPSKIKVEPAVEQSDALIAQRRPSDSEAIVKRKKKLKLMGAIADAASTETETIPTTSGNRREATDKQALTPEVNAVPAKLPSAKSDQGEATAAATAAAATATLATTATHAAATEARASATIETPIDGNQKPSPDRNRRASLKLAELVGETPLVVPAVQSAVQSEPPPRPELSETLPAIDESKEPINQAEKAVQAVQAQVQQVAIGADIAPQIAAALRHEESSQPVEATKVAAETAPADSLAEAAVMPELKVIAGPVQPVKIETVEQPHDVAKKDDQLVAKKKAAPLLKKLVRKNSIEKKQKDVPLPDNVEQGKQDANKLSNILRDRNKINELSSRINKLTPPKKQVKAKEEPKKEDAVPQPEAEVLPVAEEEPKQELEQEQEPEAEPEAEPAPVPVPKKPRKIKKKVIIKRQKRRLSISDTFFLQPEPEEPQVPEIETIERAIAYVTDDEEEVEEPPAQPDEEKEPQRLKSCLHVREYKIGDLVLYAERYRKTQVRWKRGRVLERITSISYKLEIEGKEVPAHVSYIKKYTGRKVRFGGKEYLEIDYEQVAEEERRAASYSIWNMV